MTAVALALILCLGMGVPALAEGKPASAGAPNGKPVNAAPSAQCAQIPGCGVSVLFIPAYHITIVSTRAEDSDKVKVTDINWTDGPDGKKVTATFSHDVRDQNGVVMATVHSTVRAVYSQVDNRSRMLSVSASISGPFAQSFTQSTSLSGNQGYTDLYFQGQYVCTWTYEIAADGRRSSNMN